MPASRPARFLSGLGVAGCKGGRPSLGTLFCRSRRAVRVGAFPRGLGWCGRGGHWLVTDWLGGEFFVGLSARRLFSLECHSEAPFSQSPLSRDLRWRRVFLSRLGGCLLPTRMNRRARRARSPLYRAHGLTGMSQPHSKQKLQSPIREPLPEKLKETRLQQLGLS